LPERFLFAGAERGDDYRGQCMRCGICTLRCPTFQLLGDERDGPRGRVAMAVDLLEGVARASAETVRHLDRCLSCLACTGACPFGVDHTHLWDRARARIEETYRRPVGERLLRSLLAAVLPRPGLFRLALRGAALGRFFRGLLPRRLAGLVALAPRRLPRAAGPQTGTFTPAGPRRARVALLAGCAQGVLRPSIHAATIRFLQRHGCEIVVPPEAGCCGALVLHMGRPEEARRQARANIVAWEALADDGGLDAIVINASGCGPTVKDYPALFADDPAWAARAAPIAALARDVCEVVAGLPLAVVKRPPGTRIACHNPCSLENGQGIATTPGRLLRQAGFDVVEAPEGGACCGSAGTYNMLQPDIAARLGEAKAAALRSVRPAAIATANIGCQVQISDFVEVPVVHAVELLDWATGGPAPAGLGAAGPS
jgi:glycolate oxidase iron-sulfur subunit